MAQGKPSVYLTWPTSFHPIPNNLPPTLPPPTDEGSIRSPFGVNPNLYNFALRPEIPFTFAAAYVVAVFALNAYNRKRNHEPWAISKTAAFKYFIVLHNVVLALYSFATFGAMGRAIVETWPGFHNENGAAGMADALCKLHGPRGLGDAATFNTTINIWESKNTLIHLTPGGNPDSTDVGRLWNEGLAFWGWIFYVSKFYEVLDTLIILAKGKRSATLQTYHHAGAMLCMWAGIRYMSPPIWMFVFINSAIHAMMYTYFTASALGVKVPQSLKRTLTSLQIAQFVFGASYAAAHLFIAYDIPIQTPYQVVHSVERAASSASSAASKMTSTVSDFVESPSAATAAESIGSLVKKLLLRAAGEEGVAERVAMSKPEASEYIPSANQIEQKMDKIWERRFETRYHSDWSRVNCIDTTGEAFAIYLNLLYLAPLTWLFGRFFVRAYTARGKGRKLSSPSTAAQVARDVAREAKRDTEESFEQGGKKAEDELARRSSQGMEKSEEAYDQLRKDVKSMKDGTWQRRVSERVQSYEGKIMTAAEKAKEKAKAMASGSGNDSPSRGASESKQSESAVEDDGATTTSEPAAGGAEKPESSVSDQGGEDKENQASASNTESEPQAQNSQAEKEESKPDTTGGESTAQPSEDKSEAQSGGENSEAQSAEDKSEPQPAEDKAGAQSSAQSGDDNSKADPKEETSSRPQTPSKKNRKKPAKLNASPAKSSNKAAENSKPSSSQGQQDESSSKDKTEEQQSQAEPKEDQDKAIAESEATRPAPQDDTDAMGRSGVDLEQESGETAEK